MEYIKFMLVFMKEFYKESFKQKKAWLWIAFMMTGWPLMVGSLCYFIGKKSEKEEL